MRDMLSITFTQAADALKDAQCTVSAAEAHGCLSGLLCVDGQHPLQAWIDELLPDDVESDAATLQVLASILHALHGDTVRALTGESFAFAPLLPEDDEPLSVRAAALAQWCQGYLYGFGLLASPRLQTAEESALPDEADEILRDFAQIARATAGDSEPTEEDEADYAELVEYLRAGVQLLHDSMPKRSDPSSTSTRH
jgi:yecA family protein